jgi:hypothetical protein
MKVALPTDAQLKWTIDVDAKVSAESVKSSWTP